VEFGGNEESLGSFQIMALLPVLKSPFIATSVPGMKSSRPAAHCADAHTDMNESHHGFDAKH
jgi:hypothetical protein